MYNNNNPIANSDCIGSRSSMSRDGAENNRIYCSIISMILNGSPLWRHQFYTAFYTRWRKKGKMTALMETGKNVKFTVTPADEEALIGDNVQGKDEGNYSNATTADINKKLQLNVPIVLLTVNMVID